MIRKKIILAVTNDLTYDRRMFRICSALAQGGAGITLVGRKGKDSKPFKSSTFNAFRFRCLVTKGPLFYAEYNLRLFFLLLRADYAIACACDLDTAGAVRLASWIKRKKTVYDAHEYFSEVPELNDRPVVKAIWRAIAKWTIPGFNSCYTVGEELSALMGRKYGVHFDVIRNIAPAPNVPGVSQEGRTKEKVLLYQGALNVGRGLEVCITAMADLKDWQLWLAGEGDITLQLKELAEAKGVGDRVDFLGWVKPDNLPGLIRQARIGVNLREKGSLNDFYSLPNKFFDSMQAGLPSINMNYPEYARICAKYPCALLIDEVSTGKLIEAILYLDEHPAAWQSMSNACLEAAKEYNWANESNKLISIYGKL